MKKILVFCLALVFISSCHIEKRRYLPGYSTSWSIGFGKNHDKTLIQNRPVITDLSSTNLDSASFCSQNETLDTAVFLATPLHETKSQLREEKSEFKIKQKNQVKIANTPKQKFESFSSNHVLAEESKVESQEQQVSLGNHGNTDLETLLLVILSIIAPPLAVLIETGLSKAFWIDLILVLISGSFLFGLGLPFIQGLAGLSAIILALLVVFHKNPIPNATAELNPKERPNGIPWTSFIFPPLALRWLDGVKGWEIALAIFLTIFGYYLGMLFVNYLIYKYPEKVLTEEQKRIMKMNNIGILFAVLGSIASLIYLSLYTNIFNGI